MDDKEKLYLEDLFNHMNQEHGLILLESEMQDIIHLCKIELINEKDQYAKDVWNIINAYGTVIPVNVKISIHTDIINYYVNRINAGNI